MLIFNYLRDFLVPRPGIEPGWVAPLVFETSASTDSAIWAFASAKILLFSYSAKFFFKKLIFSVIFATHFIASRTHFPPIPPFITDFTPHFDLPTKQPRITKHYHTIVCYFYKGTTPPHLFNVIY